ncbi:hypothetical protein CERZMDRAFT_86683 [Cercospora zeae-maydis SCOH1-5]|uniref:Uncharacterized protein n=1 Tax=Cercospora zeae-maydis SCOH1-5 TaxID=717836 RepID=A0A6A6F863_9PEZI|nr:hypothetical protein CERZMDRAFT_86683 [Cercospora zeae-maydis SCOH1-5]
MAPTSSAPSTTPTPADIHQDRCLNTIARFIRIYFVPEMRDNPNFTLPHNILVLLGHPEPRPIVAFCNKAQFEKYGIAKPKSAADEDKKKQKQKQKKKQQLSGARNNDEASGGEEGPEVQTAVCLNGVDYDVLWKETDLPSERFEYSEEFWTELFDGKGELKIPYVIFADLGGNEEEERVEEEKAKARKEKKMAKKERRAAEKKVREEE